MCIVLDITSLLQSFVRHHYLTFFYLNIHNYHIFPNKEKISYYFTPSILEAYFLTLVMVLLYSCMAAKRDKKVRRAFYQFPLDVKRREEWASTIKSKNWVPTEYVVPNYSMGYTGLMHAKYES